MPVSISGTNGVTFPDSSLQAAAASPYVLKNRIINGDMRIDQRNAGASFNTTAGAANTYSVDRWRIRGDNEGIMTVQQVTDAPTGFTNSLKILTQTVDSSIGSTQVYAVNQLIEGYNTADFGWGTASAKTITLSFWVKSSLTGTFGGAIKNNAQTRAYPFTYTISSANTWEQKTITITGDTSGTWETTTSAGVWVNFSMGAGEDRLGTAGAWANSVVFGATGETSLISTLNATWQITGVQLEQNTTATPFERRLYGQELANCQRYYEKSYELLTAPGANTSIGVVHVSAASNGFGDMLTMIKFNVEKRTAPTMTFYREDGTSGSWNMERSGSNTTPSVTSSSVGDNGGRIYCATGANWTVASLKGHWTSSAEL
jgi:hypothetical protein